MWLRDKKYFFLFYFGFEEKQNKYLINLKYQILTKSFKIYALPLATNEPKDNLMQCFRNIEAENKCYLFNCKKQPQEQNQKV